MLDSTILSPFCSVSNTARLSLMASRAQWTQHSACGLHVMTVNVGSMLTVMTLGCLVLITLQILTGYVMIVCN